MNRSEELCKLLGLSFIRWQGKKTMFPTFDKDDPCTNEYQYFNTEQEAIIFGKSGDKINKPKEKILDLTKPSNFVKLLENIKIDGIELCDWLICYAGSFCNRQDFIDILVGLIEEYTNIIGGLTQDIKKIKQQAQQIEWEY